MRGFIKKIARYKVAILEVIVAFCIVAYVISKLNLNWTMTIILTFLVVVLCCLIVRYIKLIRNRRGSTDEINGEKNIVIIEMVIVITIIGLFPLSNLIQSIFGIIINNGNRANSLTSSQISNQDKEIYNSMINNYIGERKRGSEVKVMIDNVIDQNDTYAGERGKFISIKVKGNIPNYYRPEVLSIICDAANTYSGGVNTQENVDLAKAEMRLLSKVISAGKVYVVEPEQTDGIIHTVYIKLAK